MAELLVPKTELTADKERGKIRPGVTLKDLIKERNYHGSLSFFVDQIIDEWNSGKVNEIKENLGKSLPEIKYDESGVAQFETENVTLPDANVRILGVRHGPLGIFKLKSEYGRALRNHVKDTAKKVKWFTEEGVDRSMGIEESVNGLEDITEYRDIQISEKDLNTRSLYYSEVFTQFKAASSSQSFLKSPELERMFFTLRKKISYERKGDQSLSEIKFIDIAALPQPLEIETSLILSGREEADDLLVDRSRIQAKQLLSEIKDLKQSGKIPEVGLVCGDAHKKQVAYFLTHPDFDPRESIREAKKLLI